MFQSVEEDVAQIGGSSMIKMIEEIKIIKIIEEIKMIGEIKRAMRS
jgi:hypothetical protein